MKKILKFIIFVFLTSLLVSCHAQVLMHNGEITKPNNNAVSKDTVEEFDDKTPPENVNATASFYTDKIRIRWKAVKGADFYTIEKAEHTKPFPSSDTKWINLGVAVTSTSYEDRDSLKPAVYYSYRITPHTFMGKSGATSKHSTGTILTSPVKINASKGTDLEHIFLTWEQTPNAEEYKIYKSTLSTIIGVDSEYIATVEATDSSLENTFAYKIIPGKEEGKELYFAISAVCNNNSTKISLPRSGFTKVLGAPQQPLSIISKGENLNSITVQFISPTEDASTPFDYVIKRSYPGSTESEVFSTQFGDKLVKNENGYYVYEDTDVYDNVEYTYSIMASDSKGNKSEAMVDTGYVLSPVTELVLSAEDRGSEIGYKANFKLPVGYDNEKYVYKIVTTLKDGTVNPTVEIKSCDIATSDLFYPVSLRPTIESEKTEIRSVAITVSNGSYETTSVISNSIKDLDYAITNITATHNNKPKADDVPNALGVYPVHINFETLSENDQTLIRKGSDGSVLYIPIKIAQNGKYYCDTETEPLITYDYYINNSDELGRTIAGERGVILHANGDKNNESYGSVTKQLYREIFESVALKPWEMQKFVPQQYRNWWKSTNLAIMIGYGNASDLSTQMKALGNAQANDHSSRNGLVRYSASMEGMGGQIYFYYTNFGESEKFYINGEYEMHVNAGGNGSAGSKSGGLSIIGMYPGKCSLKEISVGSKAFRGTYIFEYNYEDGTEIMRVGI